MSKVVVITGAASGLGLQLTECCLARNYNVVMVDNNVATLSEQVNRLQTLYTSDILSVECDIRDLTQVDHLKESTLKHFNRIDWLMNNAGITGVLNPIWEQSVENIQKVMDINLYGAIHCTKAFLPVMFEQTHPTKIINMASLYSVCSGSYLASYAMSKHAVLAFSESLYFDLQRLKKKTQVSVVCPSFFNTPLLANSIEEKSLGLQHVLSEFMSKSRSTEEIAEAIMQGIDEDTFYILPDPEVSKFCEQRTFSITHQQKPYVHGYEKLITKLSARLGSVDI